jgi:hypothetical protein
MTYSHKMAISVCEEFVLINIPKTLSLSDNSDVYCNVCVCVCVCVSMYVCMYVCMYVYMYVCMYVWGGLC